MAPTLLTPLPFIPESTLEALSLVIRAAAQFYLHRRRTPQTGRGLADFVEAKLKQKSAKYDDRLIRVVVYGPTDWKLGRSHPTNRNVVGMEDY